MVNSKNKHYTFRPCWHYDLIQETDFKQAITYVNTEFQTVTGIHKETERVLRQGITGA